MIEVKFLWEIILNFFVILLIFILIGRKVIKKIEEKKNEVETKVDEILEELEDATEKIEKWEREFKANIEEKINYTKNLDLKNVEKIIDEKLAEIKTENKVLRDEIEKTIYLKFLNIYENFLKYITDTANQSNLPGILPGSQSTVSKNTTIPQNTQPPKDMNVQNKPKRKKDRSEEIRQAIKLYKNGVGIRKIGRKLNIAPSTIHYWKEKFLKNFENRANNNFP